MWNAHLDFKGKIVRKASTLCMDKYGNYPVRLSPPDDNQSSTKPAKRFTGVLIVFVFHSL